VDDRSLTYRWPRSFAYFTLALYYAMALIPVLLPQARIKEPILAWLTLPVFLVVGTWGFVYFLRFRIVLDEATIRSGAFFHKAIPYREITRVRYTQGRYARLILYSSSGKRIYVPETIDRFRACVTEIKARLPVGLYFDLGLQR
jgi:hypothetical protein